MTVVGAMRPDAWNLPLLVHVLGAMTLVGGLVSCAAVIGRAGGDAAFLRLGYWSLVLVAVPGWVLMRVGGEWIASKERLSDLPEEVEPRWLSIGEAIADIGGALLLAAVVVGGVGIARLRRGRGAGLLHVTLALALLLAAAYAVAAWAMAGKPE